MGAEFLMMWKMNARSFCKLKKSKEQRAIEGIEL